MGLPVWAFFYKKRKEKSKSKKGEKGEKERKEKPSDKKEAKPNQILTMCVGKNPKQQMVPASGVQKKGRILGTPGLPRLLLVKEPWESLGNIQYFSNSTVIYLISLIYIIYYG